MNETFYPEKWGNILKPYKNKTKNYLEIGLDKGITLPIWQEYFNCNVSGIDINLNNLQIDKSKFSIYEMNALDKALANTLFKAEQFDVIVDDSDPFSHVEIFNIFQKFLAKGGIYIIETFKSKYVFYKNFNELKSMHKKFCFKIGFSSLSKQFIIYGNKLTS